MGKLTDIKNKLLQGSVAGTARSSAVPPQGIEGGTIVRSAGRTATIVPPTRNFCQAKEKEKKIRSLKDKLFHGILVKPKSIIKEDSLSLNSILESGHYPISKQEAKVLTTELKRRHVELSQNFQDPEPAIFPTSLDVIKTYPDYQSIRKKIQAIVYKYTLQTIKVRKGYTFSDGTILKRGNPITLLDPICIKELPIPLERQELLRSCLSFETILCYCHENIFTIEKEYLKI